MSATFDPDAPAQPGSGMYGLPQDARSALDAKVGIISVPFEVTVSYRSGTANGPQAIQNASRQVELEDREVGRAYQVGFCDVFLPESLAEASRLGRMSAETIIAEGGVHEDSVLESLAGTVDDCCVQMNAWVYKIVGSFLRSGHLSAVVGGDHSVAFGSIKAHAERYPGMGILHLDAHHDLRRAYEGFTWSHASIMYNVAERIPEVSQIVQVGIRDSGQQESEYVRASNGRIVVYYDHDMALSQHCGKSWAQIASEIVGQLPQQVYLSFDIDGLDPTLCPNTGTPVPGGLNWHQICLLLSTLGRSGKTIVGLDLCEVAPGPNGDEWDGNVGARLLYKMIGWMLRSQGLIEPPTK